MANALTAYWTFDATAATLAQVVASTGAERVNVVAISIGGMVARAFALAHNETLRSLVLIGTAATFPEEDAALHATEPQPHAAAA